MIGTIVKLALVVISCAVMVNGQFGIFNGFFRRPGGRRPPPRGPPQGLRGGGGGCSQPDPNNPDETRFGKRYWYSWRHGCGNMNGGQAKAYCRSGGMSAFTLDTRQKSDFFVGVLSRNRGLKYFWTGGNVQHRAGQVSWEAGGASQINSIGPWSHTGGNRRPQPDNREAPESCLGLLKDVYSDGIKLHDINCSHSKPVICEI